MSYNTAVSAFMVCINGLSDLKCNKRAVLEPLAVLISPLHLIAEELWSLLGNKESISYASFPVLETKYLTESAYNYPISFNGKMRFVLSLPIDMNKDEIEKAVLQAPKLKNGSKELRLKNNYCS